MERRDSVRVEHRLAAILAADVVGYSRLMAADEADTLIRLKRLIAEFVEPTIAEHRGRLFKTMGDGLLVEFGSAIEAVKCAVTWQEGIAEQQPDLPDDRRMLFRIGINLGDVIIEGGDVFGDGVNVAARLQALAEPGGILVSGSLHEQVQGKVEFSFLDHGEQKLKNIPRPVRAYRVDTAAAKPMVAPAALTTPPALPDQPSIAVLPFTNMSGDPEQEYFADGMVEDIITALSRFKEVFVIARNSSFVYKGRAVDIREVGRELGVRYVLEGSVRKAANQVRISAQLIDASTGAHLWADRFEGAIGDVFHLQDQITASVVGAIAPTLRQAEIERARRKPPANLDAYDYLLRALPYVIANTPVEAAEAIRLLGEALRLDPNYAYAHGLLATAYGQIFRSAVGEQREESKQLGTEHARKAVALGTDDSAALAYGGFMLLLIGQDVDSARTALEKAVALNPNSAIALTYRSLVLALTGESQAAIDDAMKALRLSPLDTSNYLPPMGIAIAHIWLGQYEEAATWAKKATEINPRYPMGYAWWIVAECGRGNRLEAEAQFRRLTQILPDLQPDGLPNLFAYFPPRLRDRVLAALRGAGFVTAADSGGATNSSSA